MLILHPPANLGSLGDLGSLDNLCLRLHHLVLDILGGRGLGILGDRDLGSLDNLCVQLNHLVLGVLGGRRDLGNLGGRRDLGNLGDRDLGSLDIPLSHFYN